MSWYLSPTNRSLIQPFLKLLRYPEKGEVKLHANSCSRLIYILRNAANTEYPELKHWKFKNCSDHVLAVPKDVILIEEAQKIETYLDYIGLIEYLTLNVSYSELIFTQAYLTGKEFSRLLAYAENQSLTITRDESGLRVKNERRNKNSQTSGSNEG